MYCSSCGAAAIAGLSYCNRCGAELAAKEPGANKLSELSPGLVVCAIVAVTFVGLGSIIALLALLKQSPEFAGVIMGFSALSFLLVLAAEIVFIWLLLRPKTGKKEAGDLTQHKGPALKELRMAHERVLPEPASSVTEHTTRTLEPVHGQQESE
jgi:hypothetical protein